MRSRLLRPERLLPTLGVLALLATPTTVRGQDSATAPIAPRFGTGVLWVRPLPFTPRELAAMISGRTPDEIHDSAVVALTQHFLDAMAEDADARAEHRPPQWTTSVGGQTLGIDQQWIHLGPLRIPTALLALLPLDIGVNPTELDRFRRLASMRDDLLTAGRRSANLADFRDAVRRLREEREAQRAFERNRRTAPPDEGGTR